MKILTYKGVEFEVEEHTMGFDELDIAFLDENDFGTIYEWVRSADLSRIELEDEDGATVAYEGYSVFKSMVFMQATENDFWEGLRAVVVLSKPLESEK